MSKTKIEKVTPKLDPVEVEVLNGVCNVPVDKHQLYDNVLLLFNNNEGGIKKPLFSKSTRLRSVEVTENGFAAKIDSAKVRKGTMIEVRDVVSREVVANAVITSIKDK